MRNGTIHVAKTKALISLADTALIYAFVFAYAKCWFSHDVAHCGTNMHSLRNMLLMWIQKVSETAVVTVRKHTHVIYHLCTRR